MTDDDQQQLEEESDSVVPKTQQNPFAKPDIDKIILQQFDEDKWRIMRGGLPCLETTAICLQQLQEKAVLQSPLLKEIDNKIQEANDKINQAKVQNQKSIRLSIFSPALQYLLNPQTINNGSKKQNTGGLIDNLAALFTGKVSMINGILKVIGIPLFEGSQGGGDSAQTRSIQIGDLQIKVAQLQKERAQLADTVRQKVAEALTHFDDARVNYQMSQIIAARTVQQFHVYEFSYLTGNSNTETYLSRHNSLDSAKAQTYTSWSQMRRALFELKLLVLNVQEAEN
jgi:hypothetical protein